ncbi:MAG: hypothetical protein IBJ07_11955 [Rhizobiaceae bacterium]|nr:hypothetical protein [Rhizobiaceae bacterium]
METTAAQARDVEIDAEFAARAFGIPVAQFIVELRRGNIHGLVEDGAGEDAGRRRLRLRYRGRELRLILEAGRIVQSPLDENAPPPERDILAERVRLALSRRARHGVPVAIDRLTDEVDPRRRKASAIREALDAMTAADAAAGRPLLTALVIENAQGELPPESFFAALRAKGLFAGEARGLEAYAFHARQLRRAVRAYACPES